jgi:hypothetical protein
MPDRNGPTIDVKDIWVDSKLVAAIQDLAGKGFIDLPYPNVLDA